jgi:hypothetical protein
VASCDGLQVNGSPCPLASPTVLKMSVTLSWTLGVDSLASCLQMIVLSTVLRIRIHRIHMFLGLLDPDPDPLVRGMDPDLDPDPSITKKK